MGKDHQLRLDGVVKSYGEATVLDDISLTVGPGEVLGLTGPSGAGKTTICRLISGIEKPDAGSVMFGDRDVTDLPTQERGVAYMFESYALYPQLSVANNIAFPLRSPVNKGRYSADDIERRVREVLDLSELTPLAERLPSELSGGQKQRVALCRALVQEPSVWLLDEPISHLDAKLRNKLRGSIRRRQIATDRPTIWTTPDATEAPSVADAVVVLIGGRIHQQGAPEDIYLHPANTQVARLVGDPAMNLLSGTLRREADSLIFEHEAMRQPLPPELERRIEQGASDSAVVLGIRPTAINFDDPNQPANGATISAQVYAWEPFGKYAIVSVKIGPDLVKIKTDRTHPFEINATIPLSLDTNGLVAFDEGTGDAL
jgi:multiple sugar transport system ATP-binding protein